MSTLKAVNRITVELVMSTSGNAVWEFPPEFENRARALFDALTNAVPVGSPPHGVNLIYWDSHPDRDDAVGLIIAQYLYERIS